MLLNASQQKKTEVNAKIKRDAREIKTLTKQVTEIESRIELLTNSLSKSEGELTQLNNTITETESGYQKIVEAGETLMAIVSQNLPKLESFNTSSVQQTDANTNTDNLDGFKT